MPILERGLRERKGETKRFAAQIVGNMANLADHKVHKSSYRSLCARNDLFLSPSLLVLVSCSFRKILSAPFFLLFVLFFFFSFTWLLLSFDISAKTDMMNYTFCGIHAQDLEPYLDKLIPGIRETLVDSIPETRQMSAMALGKMAKVKSERVCSERERERIEFVSRRERESISRDRRLVGGPLV